MITTRWQNIWVNERPRRTGNAKCWIHIPRTPISKFQVQYVSLIAGRNNICNLRYRKGFHLKEKILNAQSQLRKYGTSEFSWLPPSPISFSRQYPVCENVICPLDWKEISNKIKYGYTSNINNLPGGKGAKRKAAQPKPNNRIKDPWKNLSVMFDIRPFSLGFWATKQRKSSNKKTRKAVEKVTHQRG